MIRKFFLSLIAFATIAFASAPAHAQFGPYTEPTCVNRSSAPTPMTDYPYGAGVYLCDAYTTSDGPQKAMGINTINYGWRTYLWGNDYSFELVQQDNEADALEFLNTYSKDDADTLLAAKQAADADLTFLSALSTSTYGRDFNTLSDAPAARTYMGLGDVATKTFASYTGLTASPTLTTLLGSAYYNLTVTGVLSTDKLVECAPTADLPANLILSGCRITGNNTVRLTFNSSVLYTGTPNIGMQVSVLR